MFPEILLKKAVPGKNVASKEFNPKLVKGTENIFNAGASLFDAYPETAVVKPYVFQNLKTDVEGIIIELNEEYVINVVELHLWDEKEVYYSYTVEVSSDGRNWVYVYKTNQHAEGLKSIQTHEFCPRIVKFIRINGRQSKTVSEFAFCTLKAFYRPEKQIGRASCRERV